MINKIIMYLTIDHGYVLVIELDRRDGNTLSQELGH